MKTAVQQARANSRSGEKTFQWFVAILLTVGGLLMVLPFAWMILSSFKTESEVTQIPPTIWPQHFTLDNFKTLFDSMAFGTYLTNTLVIVLASFFWIIPERHGRLRLCQIQI